MKRVFLVFFSGAFMLFILTSCTFQYMDDGLAALKGKPIQTAFDYLGYPDNEQIIAGSKVYTWENAFQTTTVTPVTTYNSGSVIGVGGSATYNGSSTTYIPETNHYACKLKIIANNSGTIVGSQYTGDEGGCSDYGVALGKAAEDLSPQVNVVPVVK